MSIMRRILNDLASDLGYRLSQEEEDLYFEIISSYPLSLVSDLALEVLDSGDYARNHFPSIAFFKSRLSGKIKANQLKD